MHILTTYDSKNLPRSIIGVCVGTQMLPRYSRPTVLRFLRDLLSCIFAPSPDTSVRENWIRTWVWSSSVQTLCLHGTDPILSSTSLVFLGTSSGSWNFSLSSNLLRIKIYSTIKTNNVKTKVTSGSNPNLTEKLQWVLYINYK